MPTAARHDTRFRVDEKLAHALAEAYGTPLYVLDEQMLRDRIRSYIAGFSGAWPKSRVAFASKANSTLAVLAITAQEGCLIDAASEGELRAALLAGIPAELCHLHGNNKQPEELAFAFEAGVGAIVVDNFAEIELVSDLARTDEPASKIVGEVLGVEIKAGRKAVKCPQLLLRLAPGVDPITHHKISTGQEDTKFGFNISDGSAERAVRRCVELNLPLIGFHCHVGSQLLDPEAQCAGGEAIAAFAVSMKRALGLVTQVINVGGGLGIRYVESDNPMSDAEYSGLVVEAIRKALDGSGLDPLLVQEPGRALIGECGLTLYRVGVVKTVPTGAGSTRTYVCVDGGLSDNPRPALYGSRYTVEVAGTSSEELSTIWHYEQPGAEAAPRLRATHPMQTVTVSGRHCETDRLFPDVSLPSDLAPGDLLQVLCTGAYNSSMASNYNRFPRPAMALVRPDGTHCLIQRPETWDEMFARELMPSGLGVQ